MAKIVDYKLGRIVQHDPRSRRFAIGEVDLNTLKSVRWERYAPVFDQGDIGSCTGQACLGALSTGNLYRSIQEFDISLPMTQDYAVDLYSQATKLDDFPGEYPPDDTGSSGLAIAKVAKANGYISAYSHAFTFNSALTALASGPVISGVTWYSSFFIPNKQTGECAIHETAVNSGGHEICMDEINFEKKQVWFTNSWGSDWGIDGRAWFSFDTWERLLAEQGDVTKFTPPIQDNGIDIDVNNNPGCIVGLFSELSKRILNGKIR